MKLLRRYRFFLTFFVAVLTLSLGIVAGFVKYKNERDVQQMEYLAVVKSNEIIEAIYALLYKAEALSTLVIQGNGEIRDLERIAPIIINSPVIRNILLAPNGIVSRIYPQGGNDELLGYDLLGPGEGNEEARLARDSRRLTLGGPFNPRQGGGQVLVGRLPVYAHKDGSSRFWGLVSVTLSYPEALSPVRLNELDNLGFACEIWRVNPDRAEKQIILRTKSVPLAEPFEREFSLLNARWMISISPLYPWYRQFSLYAMLVAALLFSGLIAAIAQNYWEMRQVRKSLEHMAMFDSLTGLPNRRSAFERLDLTIAECREAQEPFVLGYIDLNDFKDINDTYGHHIGDYVLKETAQRITASIPPGQFAARIGGDEFIILLRGMDAEKMTPVLDKLCEAMKPPFAAKVMDGLHASLSMGLACFPDNGTTAETLTAYADAAMYANKDDCRSRRRIARRDMTAMAFMVSM